MSKQTIEEAVHSRWPITDDLTRSDRNTFEMFHNLFKQGAAWQKEQVAVLDMIEALRELLRFEHVMTEAAYLLQYPDNYLKAIEGAKAALAKALD